jgi:hypothetical protein
VDLGRRLPAGMLRMESTARRHGSSEVGRRAGDDGGLAPLSISGEWAWSTIGGGIRRWLETLENEWEVWDPGAGDPYK